MEAAIIKATRFSF